MNFHESFSLRFNSICLKEMFCHEALSNATYAKYMSRLLLISWLITRIFRINYYLRSASYNYLEPSRFDGAPVEAAQGPAMGRIDRRAVISIMKPGNRFFGASGFGGSAGGGMGGGGGDYGARFGEARAASQE